jgi:hypothetical protein
VRALLGRWRTDPSDEVARARFGDVTLEFKDGGKLVYTIHEGGKEQIILMTFRIQEGLLITDQPSHPREEHTPFELDPRGRLSLYYDKDVFSLVREG